MAGHGEQCDIQILNVRHKGPEPPKYGLKNLSPNDNISYALVLERTFNEKNLLQTASLQVNSPHLLKIFKSAVGYHPTVPADYDVPFQMESPFQMLFHYWDELHAAQDQDDLGDEARMHLNLLLGFMKADLGPSKDRVDSMVKVGAIGFSTLWTIFRPGCLVYTEKDGFPWILRLEKTAYEETVRAGKFFEVHCTYSDYDGSTPGQATHQINIMQKRLFAAENPCKITKLPVFPLDWLDDEDIAERLAERGARFLDIQGIQVKAYNGLARYLNDPPYSYYDPEMGDFPGVWLPFTETGRVVLDARTFKEERYSELDSVVPADVSDKSKRMLCPPYAYGFSLSRKEWCRFYIDNLSDPDWNKSALDGLILPEERKSVLQALVFSHTFPHRARDEMKLKGKGLVILLHGNPGSGKTLTAGEVSFQMSAVTGHPNKCTPESVAEATEKALLTATIGELNRENVPSQFESRLKEILQYATIWKAVVLLDEADVFLEGRSEAVGVATAHNALVAVFLKQLEYFSGIVFLTSNRVIVFDRAMKSRIHLALEYQAPDAEMRRRIWMGCLSAIPADEIDLDIDEDVEMVLQDEINGREIANCVGTARTLARFKGVRLSVDHLHTVLQTRRDFERSLRGIRAKRQLTDPAKAGSFQLARRDTLEAGDD
ncbi:hypothetical protein H2200_013436 [Cladophialophora chaetospira]|uniref:AAA+ ATPase domain-containing protein n=1 Tax=Cladophialophora chaetospira TaxID=386627 RepID=A0AA38U9L6_9EURO|nr:hypothetical protein H2200_013436 [Cladophialophora chaetospira]